MEKYGGKGYSTEELMHKAFRAAWDNRTEEIKIFRGLDALLPEGKL